MVDFESMTLDEIIGWKVAKKREVLALKAEYRQSNAAYNRKVSALHYDEAARQLTLAAERSGRTVEEQAWYWLTEENAEDNGHRVQAGLYLRGRHDASD